MVQDTLDCVVSTRLAASIASSVANMSVPLTSKASMKRKLSPAPNPLPSVPPRPSAKPLHLRPPPPKAKAGPVVQPPWLVKVNAPHNAIDLEAKHNPGLLAFSLCRPLPGIPPPMASILASLELMQQWNARWAPKNLNAVDFRPEKDLITIFGRKVGVICCTRHGAGPLV